MSMKILFLACWNATFIFNENSFNVCFLQALVKSLSYLTQILLSKNKSDLSSSCSRLKFMFWSIEDIFRKIGQNKVMQKVQECCLHTFNKKLV